MFEISKFNNIRQKNNNKENSIHCFNIIIDDNKKKGFRAFIQVSVQKHQVKNKFLFLCKEKKYLKFLFRIGVLDGRPQQFRLKILISIIILKIGSR